MHTLESCLIIFSMFAEQIITVIGGIIEKELDAREKAQQKRIKKYTDKYAKKEVAEA